MRLLNVHIDLQKIYLLTTNNDYIYYSMMGIGWLLPNSLLFTEELILVVAFICAILAWLHFTIVNAMKIIYHVNLIDTYKQKLCQKRTWNSEIIVKLLI